MTPQERREANDTPQGTYDYKVGMVDNKLGLDTFARMNFVRAAKAGNPEAQNILGWYWANGLGHLPKNTIFACNWYAEAADQGLPEAMNNLGACYEYPGFIQQDMNRAIALYTQAARKGNSQAQASLVRLGRPVPPTDLVPHQPAKQEVQKSDPVPPPPQPVAREVPQQSAPSSLATAPRQQVVLRNELEQPASAGSSSADGFAALAVAALNVFAASKSYGTAPAPVFIPPRTINVHCISQALGGGMVTTNCN